MYQQWLDFVRREYPNQDGQLLELACGTGRLGVLLAQAGYQVTGLDLSENMLALAQRHADEAAVTLPLLQGICSIYLKLGPLMRLPVLLIRSAICPILRQSNVHLNKWLNI